MSGRRGKIRHAYESVFPEPLIAAAGETLILEDRKAEWPGWLWGVHSCGRAGWVPEVFVEREDHHGTLHRDYDATELTVTVGQAVTPLLEYCGWLRCRTESGALGWVPAECVEIVEEGGATSAASHPHPLPGRQQVKAALLASDEAYRALVDHSVQGLFITQGTPPRIVFANEPLRQIIGYSPQELCDMTFEELVSLVPIEDHEVAYGHYQQRLAGGRAPERLQYRIIHKDGRVQWVEELVTQIVLSGEPSVMAAVMDITDRKRFETEREKLITDLKHALAEVKPLRGILPLCGHCKKVRDAQGEWKPVELYLHEQTGTEVSHSLCPDCVVELYPDYAQRYAEDL